jgi:hypothetical protein
MSVMRDSHKRLIRFISSSRGVFDRCIMASCRTSLHWEITGVHVINTRHTVFLRCQCPFEANFPHLHNFGC